MAHFCTITVKGTGSEGYHGDTHRPRRDQTRSLDKFFRGMSAYGRAVTDHVLGCPRCTPAKILPLIRDEVAATMQPDRMIKRLMRQDPRTPRRAYARALGGLGWSKHVVWAARFLNTTEFWQFLLGLQDSCDRELARAPQSAPWYVPRMWQVEIPDPEGDRPWSRKRVMLHEALPPGTDPRKMELAKAAATLNMWGCRIPSTQRELRKILPLTEVHGA